VVALNNSETKIKTNKEMSKETKGIHPEPNEDSLLRELKKECFECGAHGDIHMHHPVPRSRGGTMVIPLCIACHRKAHHMNGNMSIGV